MQISFSPQGRGDPLIVTKSGDILTINGEAFDFSDVPNGATIPTGEVPCHYADGWPIIVGPIQRTAGELILTLLLPIGPNPEPFQAFPEPLLAVPDGPVDLPFNTYVTETSEHVEGGTNQIVTTHRWHQQPEVVSTFVPDLVEPETDPANEEPDHVEA